MQKFLFIGVMAALAVVGFLGVCYTQGQSEQIKISSYYPSPYGVYQTVRLYPSTTPVENNPCSNAGEMAFDASSGHNYPIYCNGSQWLKLKDTSTLKIRYGTVVKPGLPVCRAGNPNLNGLGNRPWLPVFYSNIPSPGNGGHMWEDKEPRVDFPSGSFTQPPAVILTPEVVGDCGSVSCRVIHTFSTYFTYSCWNNQTIRCGADKLHWMAAGD